VIKGKGGVLARQSRIGGPGPIGKRNATWRLPPSLCSPSVSRGRTASRMSTQIRRRHSGIPRARRPALAPEERIIKLDARLTRRLGGLKQRKPPHFSRGEHAGYPQILLRRHKERPLNVPIWSDAGDGGGGVKGAGCGVSTPRQHVGVMPKRTSWKLIPTRADAAGHRHRHTDAGRPIRRLAFPGATARGARLLRNSRLLSAAAALREPRRRLKPPLHAARESPIRGLRVIRGSFSGSVSALIEFRFAR
jgi:hypothetical protein